MTRRSLAEVTRIYQGALMTGRAPVQAVEAELGISRSYAGHLVRQARQAGLLTPTVRGRKSPAAPQPEPQRTAAPVFRFRCLDCDREITWQPTPDSGRNSFSVQGDPLIWLGHDRVGGLMVNGVFVPEVAGCRCGRSALRADICDMALRAGWTPPRLPDLLAKVTELTSSPWSGLERASVPAG